MSIVILKIILVCEKAKADTRTPNQVLGAIFIITEMAVFTPDKDYSYETGYPFDGSRQICYTS